MKKWTSTSAAALLAIGVLTSANAQTTTAAALTSNQGYSSTQLTKAGPAVCSGSGPEPCVVTKIQHLSAGRHTGGNALPLILFYRVTPTQYKSFQARAQKSNQDAKTMAAIGKVW
jgi:hypothetical protein